MQLNEELAEVVGAFIGDGCMSEFPTSDRGMRTIVLFTGHWENDKEYYERTIAPAIHKEFGGTTHLYHRKDDTTIRYVLTSKKAVGFFKGLGLPVGEKGENLGIPKEITEKSDLMLACVRGIFNTDGSVYRRYSRKYGKHSKAYRNYAVVQFKMKSRPVVEQVRASLQMRGIRVNKMTRSQSCNVIRITDQMSVRKFFDIVGFTSPYHKKRYLTIMQENSA